MIVGVVDHEGGAAMAAYRHGRPPLRTVRQIPSGSDRLSAGFGVGPAVIR